MTTVQFIKQKGQWIGYNCFGHSGYGKSGEDIVCASISTAVQMIATGITEVQGIQATVKCTEEPAEFCLILKSPSHKTQDMIETLYRTIKELNIEYPKYVKLEVIEKC